MNTDTQTTQTPPRLIPLSKWNTHHEWPPQGGLRHLAFHRHTNGFAHCLVQCGRRLLINEAKFFEWLQTQQNN